MKQAKKMPDEMPDWFTDNSEFRLIINEVTDRNTGDTQTYTYVGEVEYDENGKIGWWQENLDPIWLMCYLDDPEPLKKEILTYLKAFDRPPVRVKSTTGIVGDDTR